MDRDSKTVRSPYSDEKKVKSPSRGNAATYIVGFVLALIIVFTLFDPAKERLGLPTFAAILLYWAMILIFFLIGIVLHSVGKLVMSLLSGYRVLVFTAGPLCFVRERGKFVRKELPTVFSFGQCIMAPPRADTPEQAKYFWCYFGGAFFEIVCAALCGSAVVISGDPVVRWILSAGAFTFVILSMTFLIPSKKGVPNEGEYLRILSKDPQARVIDNHILVISGLEADGVKTGDMPDELFAGADVNGVVPYCSMASLKASYLMMRGEYEQAHEMLEELLKNPAVEAHSALRTKVRSSLACCLMMLGREPQRVEELLDEMTIRRVKAVSEYSAAELRCLYMQALISKKDPAGAEMIFVQATGMKNKILCLTDYEEEMALMQKLRAEANK